MTTTDDEERIRATADRLSLSYQQMYYFEQRFRALEERVMSSEALTSILAERARQDVKWGEQNLDPFTYLAVLTEEVGELAQAALHTRFGGMAAAGLRIEAVHVAAVALAIVECLDRGKWRWPEVSHE